MLASVPACGAGTASLSRALAKSAGEAEAEAWASIPFCGAASVALAPSHYGVILVGNTSVAGAVASVPACGESSVASAASLS